MYSADAIARRRCTGIRADGEACRAWAAWDDPRQRCVAHAGRHHRGPLPTRGRIFTPATRYEPCRCEAYRWPHRPGGGLCRWPAPPLAQHETPAGTHAELRRRRPKHWARYLRVLRDLEQRARGGRG
ncbi:MAG: hypothetical protein H0V51_26195 [Chloroflexi bacterium]|nr:hypothetical protein [Chloroflexota bacterium]